MIIWLCVVIFLLVLVCSILVIKIYVMKKSLKSVVVLLDNILKSDTNNLITVTSSDNDIKKLVISLNNELEIFRKQKLQYQSGNQELKKNITNISHDLRTPLTAINGYIDLLQKENLLPSQERILDILKKKSVELTELTEQLFDFSKFMDLDISFDMDNFCVNEILEESLLGFYTAFKEKGIVPDVVICEEKVCRVINKVSIIRVFENILSNALKYGEGDFRVELNRDGKIIFSNKASFLDSTSAQKIFDRYFTVENGKPATGIGLSIVKQLVELNRGSIDAKYFDGCLIIEVML